jgi:hypothetical protein
MGIPGGSSNKVSCRNVRMCSCSNLVSLVLVVRFEFLLPRYLSSSLDWVAIPRPHEWLDLMCFSRVRVQTIRILTVELVTVGFLIVSI